MARETLQYETVAGFNHDVPCRCGHPILANQDIGLTLGNEYIHLHCRRKYRIEDAAMSWDQRHTFEVHHVDLPD